MHNLDAVFLAGRSLLFGQVQMILRSKDSNWFIFN